MIIVLCSMHDIWATLPNEIINMVLEYDDTIRLRYGKYMNRISKCDSRYLPLFLRPKCKLVMWDNFNFEVTIINKRGRKLIVTYDIENNKSSYYYQSLLTYPVLTLLSRTFESNFQIIGV